MATEDNTAEVTKKLEESSLVKDFVEISFAGRGLKLDKAEDGKTSLVLENPPLRMHSHEANRL